nr:phosphonate ABC transporter, permease protein PhnE [Chloroflexota bacterium]
MTASAATSQAVSRPQPPSRVKRNIAVAAALALLVWALVSVEVDLGRLVDLPARLASLFGRMFLPPDWSYIPIAAEGMVASIQMAWIGTIIGAVLSLPLGFFGAKNVSSGPVSNVVRMFLNAVRAFPELVLAIVVFVPIAGLGPVAGALAIGVHSVGTLGKLTAEAVEGIDPGPVEAARATGARPIQVQRWGVLPQVLPEIVAFWLYRFEINLRSAAVLGIVGAGGIGAILSNTLSYRRFDKAGIAIMVVIVATIAIDYISGAVRRRIIEGSGARRVIGDEFEQPELVE